MQTLIAAVSALWLKLSAYIPEIAAFLSGVMMEETRNDAKQSKQALEDVKAYNDIERTSRTTAGLDQLRKRAGKK